MVEAHSRHLSAPLRVDPSHCEDGWHGENCPHDKLASEKVTPVFKCRDCNFIAKSKAGRTKHESMIHLKARDEDGREIKITSL